MQEKKEKDAAETPEETKFDPKQQDLESLRSERESMYEKYEKQNTGKAETPAEIPAEDATPAAEPPSEEIPAETEPPSEPKEDKPAPPAVKEEKKEEVKEKTVPFDALYEERMKRKAYKQEADTLKDEVEGLKRELETLKSFGTPKDQYVPKEDETEYDAKFRELQAKLESHEKKLAAYDETERERKIREQRESLKRQVDQVSSELSEEGFPGFSTFEPQVVNELRGLVQQNPEFADFDTPDGWKWIYKNRVFPGVKAMFREKQREEKRAEKIEAKKKAQVIGSPGQPPAQEGPEESETEDASAYMKRRLKQSIL